MLTRGLSTLLAVGTACAVLVVPAAAQGDDDRAHAVVAMLDFWFAPENGSHYMGPPPYTPYHPRGEPASFCIDVRARPTTTSAREDGQWGGFVPFSPGLRETVRARIEAAFTFEYADRCVGNEGYRDESGRPATIVRIATRTLGDGSVGVSLEFHAGLWPGLFGWNCSVRPGDDEEWQVDRTTCVFMQS